ncbi:MAG: ATP-dependent zinc metalloprotease FtsH [Chloroflexi bacterium]|nr:ATP-dependent zinc metalloprotease FtsH [Chloroflexota bacterium]
MQFWENNDNDESHDGDGPSRPPQRPPNWRKWVSPGLLVLVMLLALLSSPGLFGGLTSTPEVSYSVVYEQLRQQNVALLDFQGETGVNGRFTRSVIVTSPSGRTQNISRFSANMPPGGADELRQLANENRVNIHATPNEPSILLSLIINFLPLVLIIGFFVWMGRRAQGQMNGIFSFGQSQAREKTPEMPAIRFEDVAGQDAAKMELEEVVDFLKQPEKYVKVGAKVPRGVLLIGPPGTGKTLMARAVAGEANVAFFSIAASEFVEMFVGVGASRVRDLFKRAKENAPAIIFVDEIDAVGRRRGTGLGGGHDEREQTLNQLLSEMDGFDNDTNIVMIAATNRPDVLDPALLRPGRFDRQITVDLPDVKGRHDILKIHTKNKPMANNVELESMARATIGFSGADIANLANEAAMNAARYDRRLITMSDFTSAYERIRLGTKRPPLSNEKDRKITAYHEAGHALVSFLIPDAMALLKTTIIPRGRALGVAFYMPKDDSLHQSRKQLEAFIRVGLAGRIAEEIVFDDVTTGAANDIQQVTQIARNMVKMFGMSDSVGMVNYGDDSEQPFLGYSIASGRDYSDDTASKLDAEIKRIIDVAYQETRGLIEDHREELDQLAVALLEKETVEREEILRILDIEDDAADILPDTVAKHLREPQTAEHNGSDTAEDLEVEP